jgi:hypothetical protein
MTGAELNRFLCFLKWENFPLHKSGGAGLLE